MSINIDLLSDDVSALSMDGASAIAMNITFARRRTRDSANNNTVQLRIPEGNELPVAAVIVVDEDILHNRNVDSNRTSGEKLIEEFPTTPEKWQKRREKKHKKKSKKHGDRSSKEGSCGSSSRRDNESEHREHSKQRCKSKRHGDKSSIDHDAGGSSTTLPTTDTSASAPSTPYYSTKSDPATPPRYSFRNQKKESDFLSYPPIVSTVDSENSISAGTVTRFSRHEHTRSVHSSSHQPQSEIRSATNNQLSLSDRESMTSIAVEQHSVHTSGFHSYANQSHVTVEDINNLHTRLRRAKKEEKQVLRIHEQLVNEVRTAKAREDEAKYHQQQVSLLFEAASLEQEQLQNHLNELHNENRKLAVILNTLEEREDERRFVEMLGSMDAKMKSYKVKKSK
ncbi:hypothetical protein ACHAXH_006703 [Discostella pseudostelligera]